MLRSILAWHLDTDSSAIRFAYGEHDKPVLAAPTDADGLRFSFSRTAGRAAVAITYGSDLGLDIEIVRPIEDQDAIVINQFSDEEKRWFLDLEDDQRTTAFLRLWTCKEAYLKGKGTGLSASLDSFSISMQQGQPPRLVSSEVDPMDTERWHLKHVDLGADLAACLATEGYCTEVRVAPWITEYLPTAVNADGAGGVHEQG
jgi:4'-phosphopantetheinyl transferase